MTQCVLFYYWICDLLCNSIVSYIKCFTQPFLKNVSELCDAMNISYKLFYIFNRFKAHRSNKPALLHANPYTVSLLCYHCFCMHLGLLIKGHPYAQTIKEMHQWLLHTHSDIHAHTSRHFSDGVRDAPDARCEA